MRQEEAQSLEFRAFLYTSPPDFINCAKHRRANTIFKDCQHIRKQSILTNTCQCCGKLAGRTPKLNFSYDTLQLSEYGPGLPLFFLFFKSIIFFLGIYLIVFVIYASVINLQGNFCQSQEHCGFNDWTNKSSVLNILDQKQNVTIQIYLIIGLSIYTIIHNIYMRKKMRKLQIHIDNFLVTPSDFSIIIRQIPSNVGNEDIQEMIDQIMEFLSQDQKIATQNLRVVQIINVYKLDRYLKKQRQNLKIIKKNLKKARLNSQQHALLSQCELPDQFANTAIVIFNRAQAKNYFIKQSSGKERCIRYFWRSYYMKSNVHRLKNQFVAISRAPEPDDIIWQNCGKSNQYLLKRRLGFYILSIFILSCGGFIQYLIEIWRQQFSKDQRNQDQAIQLMFSLLVSLTINILNTIIVRVLIIMAQHQKYDNQTQKKGTLAFRIVWFLFFNSGIFMVAISLMVKYIHNREERVRLSFITKNIVYFMAINCFSMNAITLLFNYFEIVNRVKKYLIFKHPQRYTQIQANNVYQPPKIQIQFKYANIFQIFWLTVFFMPLIPLVVLISFTALLVNFWIQKYLFSGKYMAPQMITQYLNNHVMNLLDMTVLLMNIGSFIIHLAEVNFQIQHIEDSILLPHYIGFGLSIFNIFMPHRMIIKRFLGDLQEMKIAASYMQLKQDFQITFQDTNPLCINKKRRKIRQMQKQKVNELMKYLANQNQNSFIF